MGESTCVWFKNQGIGLDHIEEALTKACPKVSRQDNRVLVEGDGVRFEVFLEQLEFPPAAGEGTKWEEAIASCDAEVFAVTQDLPAALDEMNTLISIQLSLQKLTNGFLHNTWNDQFTAPDGTDVR